MKNKVTEKQPSSATELVTATKEFWVKEIGPEYCASKVKNIPIRSTAVVLEKGGRTEY